MIGELRGELGEPLVESLLFVLEPSELAGDLVELATDEAGQRGLALGAHQPGAVTAGALDADLVDRAEFTSQRPAVSRALVSNGVTAVGGALNGSRGG